MKELSQLYKRIIKQTQNNLQNVFDSFNIDFNDLYNIADKQYKDKIDIQIEEWKEKKLLNGYFGVLANNVYRKSKVKNSEILELLIYGAYIEEQNKLQEKEQKIMYDDSNYYYQEGQKEVNKNKKPSVLDMALFLYLMEQPNYSGFNWKQYIEAIIKFNSEQIYKQAVINLQQQKECNIDSDEFQRMIERQLKQKLNINGDKISGAIDLQMIGLNNLVKVEGIKKLDNNAKIKFIAVTDEKSTEMCQSMDNKEFYIDKENIFDRYWGETQKELKLVRVRIKGLVLGINLPPIQHHWHWCRSTIMYVPPLEKDNVIEYNTPNYIRKNKYTNNKNLDSNIKNALRKLPKHIISLLKDTKYIISNVNSCYDRKNDVIYLLKDSNKYEILHEIGHVIETKLDILHDNEYLDIQKNGININQNEIGNIKGYGKEQEFWLEGNKFISDYQRRIYEQDIDGNLKINYLNYTLNTRTLGEYFSEGFRCYFQENNLLKRKDITLYNYIKGVLK